MVTSKETMASLAKEGSLLPQEEMLEVGKKKGKLFIGIPKEVSFQENRVPLIPTAVQLLVNNGHKVVIETEAGISANYQDKDYSEAGAEIAYDTKTVYQADILLKVAPPNKDEIEMMHAKQILISALQLSVQPRDTLKKLIDKKVTAIAWDFIKDNEDIYPIVRAMGEIAGNTSVLIAAEYLSNVNKGKGMMLGGISGISPTEVVILGAGTVGEFATRAAIGLGASVKVFDSSIYKLRRLQNALGMRVFTSVIQPSILMQSLKTADVVIGAIRAPYGRTPCVVSEEMVSQMKFGSVIVDVSIDQGGCFETSEVTTHAHPVQKKYGVTHYGVTNIPSRVSKTASIALSNIFTPILLDIGKKGSCTNLIKEDKGFRNGVYLYNGTLTSSILGETFKLPFKDINLFLAAF